MDHRLASLRTRFLKESPRMRLGHLAADLARIASFASQGAVAQAKPIIRESKFFAEWTADQSELEVQQLLSDLQSLLARKEREISRWAENAAILQSAAKEMKRTSEELLKLAGLV